MSGRGMPIANPLSAKASSLVAVPVGTGTGAGGAGAATAPRQDLSTLQAMHSGIDDIMDQKLSAYETHASDLVKSIKNLRNKKNELEESIAAKTRELDQCNEEVSATKAASTQCTQQLTKLQSQFANLQTQLTTAKESLAKITAKTNEQKIHLEATIAKLGAQIAQAERDAAEATKMYEEAVALQTTKQRRLQDQIDKQNAEIGLLNQNKIVLEAQVVEQQATVEAATANTSTEVQRLTQAMTEARTTHEENMAELERQKTEKEQELLALQQSLGKLRDQFQTLINQQLQHLEWILLQFLLSSQAFWDAVSTATVLMAINTSNLKTVQQQVMQAAVSAISTTPLKLAVESGTEGQTHIKNAIANIVLALDKYVTNDVYNKLKLDAVTEDNVDVDTDAYMSEVDEIIGSFKYVPFLVYFKFKTQIATRTNTSILVRIQTHLLKYTKTPENPYNVNVADDADVATTSGAAGSGKSDAAARPRTKR